MSEFFLFHGKLWKFIGIHWNVYYFILFNTAVHELIFVWAFFLIGFLCPVYRVRLCID